MDAKVKKLIDKGRTAYTEKEWESDWDANSLIRAEEIKADPKRHEDAKVHVEVRKIEIDKEKKAANLVK